MLAQKTKQEVVSEFRCAEILRAAGKVVAQTGFDAATVDEIAAAAGLAKATLYTYFPSKRDLYLGAVKREIAQLIGLARQRMEAAPTTPEKIRAFIAALVWFAEQNRDGLALFFVEPASLLPGCFHKEWKHLHAQQTQLLETVLQQGAREGSIRPVDAAGVAFLIYDLTRAWITHRRLGWSKSTADEGIQCLFDLLWDGLSVSRDPANREEAACIRSC